MHERTAKFGIINSLLQKYLVHLLSEFTDDSNLALVPYATKISLGRTEDRNQQFFQLFFLESLT